MLENYIKESMSLNESPQRALDNLEFSLNINDQESALIDIAVVLRDLDKRLSKLESKETV